MKYCKRILNMNDSIINNEYIKIPGYSRYLINKLGKIWNIEYNRLLKGSDKSNSGYLFVRLRGDNDKVISIGIHRLLTITYIKTNKDIRKLFVNHIDGIKTNNDLDNLEWSTPLENIEHAGLLGLTNKCIPILVRDPITKIVVFYPSLKAAGKALSISADMIRYRMDSVGTRVFPEIKQYKSYHSDKSWYVPGNIELDLLKNGTRRVVLLKDLKLDQGVNIKEFPCLQDLAIFLKVSPSLISKWVSAKNQPILKGLYQIKLKSDETQWRVVEDPYTDSIRCNSNPCVSVTDIETGIVVKYESQVTCSKDMKISKTCLNYRLNANQKVFSGKIYSYL